MRRVPSGLRGGSEWLRELHPLPSGYIRARSNRVRRMRHGVLLSGNERYMQRVSSWLHGDHERIRELQSVPGRDVRARPDEVPRMRCGELLRGSDR